MTFSKISKISVSKRPERVRVVKDGKRLTLTLNPALLGFANAKAANPANDGGMDP